MSSQAVPQGYKQTKVGVVPEEWEVVKFEDIFYEIKEKIGEKDIETYSISAGKGFVSQKNRFGKDISGNQNKNYILLKENQFAYNKGNSKSYQYGCIYPNITGKSISVPNVFISFDFLDKKMNMAYYAKLFEHHFLDRGLRRIISSSARMDGLLNINKKYFFELPIVKPPLKEQQKIAQILTTWDRAIEKLEALIEEKERLKKGLMQRLLSGEVRFDGFDEEWEEVKLGDFLTERNIKTPKSREYPLMAFVANKGVAHKGERYNREFLVSDSDNKKYKQTEYGDFIYSSNNLETGSIGLNLYGSASISPVYSIFQIQKPHNYQFMGNFLVSKSLLHKMIRYRQGVVYGQWRIHESVFLKIKEKIPSSEEQQKIAQTLSTADKEIELLKKELEALKEQKRGLMQRLLTGEVRVRV